MTALFSNDRQRILALWFPHLATDRILRLRLGRFWRSRGIANPRPLALSHREGNAQRIAALDEQAEALRLKPGMGIADARAMHPGIEIAEADPEADRRLLEGLADWCDRYTPLVALDETDGLFLDITGCAHLFGGEKAMLEDILSRLFQQGFDARAALASTAGAAWAMARFSHEAVIEPGEEENVLAPLPLAALRLPSAIREGLEGVGLRTVGAILAAPRAPLARRFGREPLLRLDQATGRIDETLSPRLPVPQLSVERQPAEPISRLEDIEHFVSVLSAALRSDLERRGQGARFLQLALYRLDGLVHRVSVRTSRPLREPRSIDRLFHERLAAVESDLDAGCGFELLRLSVLATSSLEERQTDFAGNVAGGEEGIALFADRIRARLGDEALLGCAFVESHIPERAVRIGPLTAQIAEGKGRPAASRRPAVRPIRLFSRPEPVEVIAAEVPEGPPSSFRWRRSLHRVARAEGPERIAPEWWRSGKTRPARDYFRVEDTEGRRFWLYRQGLYGMAGRPPRWFMHGIFA